ncbi:MAG: glycosyltransferase [Methanomicrobiales archaeon]|nr:glycosyltransferase [Methanomicrobiales archaeon]
MKVFLLANRPEQTTRLNLMRQSLETLGYSVCVPRFSSHNWSTISREARTQIEKERPDILHLFNVPDVIYSGFPKLKGTSYNSLIYDYRSPWGIELQLNIGLPGKMAGEFYESKLARSADAITTVNRPLHQKVFQYLKGHRKEITVIPNYPLRAFTERKSPNKTVDSTAPIIFIGRIAAQEGAGLLAKVVRDNPHREFWIVGDGPFCWWYRRRMGKNASFLGWQPHEKIAGFIERAGICIIPRKENALTPYSTDKSIWKLNEYLNLGKLVIASGITQEEKRKNLVIVRSRDLSRSIRDNLDMKPLSMQEGDYRFWEDNLGTIRAVYENLQKA